MLNPFSLNGSVGEQNLIQSLVNEQLRMYGVEVYYIPRKYITKNTVIREVIESKFNDAYPIEAYIDNFEGYGGQGTVLSKFGIQEQDDLTLIISRERYETYISPLMKNLVNVELSSRPKEGDLIFFPLGDRLFEIKYVEHEQPFYQLKKNYVYELRCELYRYEDEVIDTGIEDIDDEIAQLGYIQTLSLIGPGAASTATGTVSISETGALSISLSDAGANYDTLPTIGISSSPDGGTTAVGIASFLTGFTGGIDGRIASVLLTNTGAGYTVPPSITFDSTTGVGAAASASLVSNAISNVVVTNAGFGYTGNVGVAFTFPQSLIDSIVDVSSNSLTMDSTTTSYDSGSPFGVGFEDARGVAYVNSAGIVTFVALTPGQGYLNVPDVVFETPPGITATGTFKFNEIIVGAASSATARVKEWDASTNKLEISIIDGEFGPGEQIIGQESGATYTIFDSESDDLVDPLADNDTFETTADSIIDFSESNPFGMP